MDWEVVLGVEDGMVDDAKDGSNRYGKIMYTK